MSTPHKIFISYRHKDHPEFVARICDQLRQKFGHENVFLDQDTIPPMEKFEEIIRKEVKHCDAMIVLIGPQWLELMQEKGRTFETDYVQREVSNALRLRKLMVPIRIMNATLPRKDEMPRKLQGLLKYQAAELSDYDFIKKVTVILDKLEQKLNEKNNIVSTTASPSINEKITELELSAEEYFDRASMREDDDIDAAIADYSKAISLEPQDPYAYYWRGIAYRNKGDFEPAIADFTKSMELDAEDIRDIYEVRASAFYKFGDMKNAIADYTEMIHLDPEDHWTYEGRAKAHFVLENYVLALADFERADELFPLYQFWAGIAVTKYKLGYKREAIQIWFQLADIDDRYFDAKWVGKQFNWSPPLVDAAERLIDASDLYD